MSNYLDNRSFDRDIQEFVTTKYGEPASMGWSPKQRFDFGYVRASDVYEYLIESLVTESTRWIDVGGGHAIFPNHPKLSEALAERCARLVAVDPSENVKDNPYCDQHFVSAIEDFSPEAEEFDLATLRMVAEHIANPETVANKLSEIVRKGGLVVIYTICITSPVSIITKYTPFALHHPAKKILWGSEEKDTFPVEYKMNSRKTLRRVMESAGFEETSFNYVDDLSSFSRFRWTSYLELLLWKALQRINVYYPEKNILAVYKRT